MNCVSFINHGLWRRPATRQTGYTGLDAWTEPARMLGRGRFDTLFFADVIGTYDVYRGGLDTAVREATQFPDNDPSVLVPALAHATEHLDFAFTGSVSRSTPSPSPGRRRRSTPSPRGGSPGTSSATRRTASTPIPPGSTRSTTPEPATASPGRTSPSPRRCAPRCSSRPAPRGRPLLRGPARRGHLHPRPQPADGPDRHRGRTGQGGRRRPPTADRRADDIAFFQGLSFVVGSTEEETKRKNDEIDDHISVEGLMIRMSGNIGGT
ncbi:hypothetical protein [Streptomyces rubradiris]|uniref:Luciferase-like monooxygenase n=1 Tax=Streptomyces rubradiris TaxID=285531 RepID=A0ABQ3R360_STRRR|nr:hypothetical protein [Streptomyces rubradiris]GHH01443.1 hypothetical protein GCM10018792_16800 [Streptomyces rubradiris]GHI50289.1 hypothetical protein Srubr_01350 [Streptomyces rubradiris]